MGKPVAIAISGVKNSGKTTLMADIGTNGEMALGCGEHFVCCSTAAGPAFEGAQLSCGMTSAPGAISAVGWADGALRCATIGGREAVGLCGSGLLDAVAVMLELGAVDETGLTRQELEERYDEMGGKAMLRELAQLDPERAAKLHPADKKRIVRAYEVYLLTGRTITELDRESREKDPAFEAAYIILGWKDREELYRRIDARVDEMVARGLFEEVAGLLAGGLDSGSTAMQAIGYKEAAAALRGDCSREEAIETIKRETRRYAKRQLTWLRRREGALRIDWEGTPDFESALRASTGFCSAAV